jgi:hypothetical protein
MGGSTTKAPSLDVRSIRRVVVVPAGGRLGNQVFQFTALRAFIGPRDRIVLIDCDEFSATFETPVATSLLSNGRIGDRLVLGLLHRAGGLPGVGRAEVRQAATTGHPAWTIDGRVALSRGFYQAASQGALEVARKLRFRPEVTRRARAALEGLGPRVAFLHVRRGDYLSWPSVAEPAALPDAWYLAGARSILAAMPDARFVIVSDDPDHAERVIVPALDLALRPRVSRADVATDLAIMAACDAGVLSASTLSWWGAALAVVRSEGPAKGPFIAPDRWLGFRGDDWYPPNIRADFLTLAEVSD